MSSDESDDRDLHIAYCFADHGAEAEALSSYGQVHRFSIKPRPNPWCATTRAVDLMETTPAGRFDLGLFHPRCTDESNMTSIDGDPEDHENQIPRARQLAERLCDHYIIENRPRDDLRDPTVFTGKMFGLPIKYERAFETTFPVRQPPRERDLPTECSPYFYSDRTTEWWKAVKGLRGDYPKQHVAKNALPLVYVDTLVRSYFEHVNRRDAQQAQDNNGPAPREVADDQAELTEVMPQ